MAKKVSENFLDYVPAHIELKRFSWQTQENGLVCFAIEHQNVYDKIAQKLFHTPRVTHVDLDEYGSFLWKHIDGQTSVKALAHAFREEYGEAVEPLYDRIVKYMAILHNNGFIRYVGKEK
ncbi:MAG: PqqD family protein [Faecalibacterium sp.]|jgi:hypothetical protein|nr:PqqD family protein [Faecalibacterium sp.]